MPTHSLDEILHPRSIAVVGASDKPDTQGYNFLHLLLNYGYRGTIYPVNPNYAEIMGIKAYPSLRDIEGSVDYVICCIPASGVIDMIKDCPSRGVKGVHIYTGRFSETGRQDATELEQAILKQAGKRGIRLIGPNSMGLYYPREGISFGYDFPRESGSVAMASQSGGGAVLTVHLASLRGIRFSKVISYGNALDFNECDFLDYFSQDPETEIILMYLEGVKDGRRFFDTLRRTAASKPVIIIKGGRGESGVRAVASHTAAMTGSLKIWETLVAQAGAILAEDFEEMADLASSFYFLPPIMGTMVGITGVGGGPGVLAADQCEEAGLEVIPLPAEVREKLRDKGIPIWDWIGNPVDRSILGGFITTIDILRIMSTNENFDFIIGFISEYAPPFRKEDMLPRFRTDLRGYIKVKKETHKPLLVVVGEKGAGINNHNYWRWRVLSEARTKFINAGIPVYPTIERAARAARKLVDYYRRRG